MKHLLYFTFVGLLLSSLSLTGQNYTACSTPSPKFAPQFGARAENLTANPYVVQIFVHILRDDDGSNAAMSDATLQANLDRMSDFYRPHNICFTFVGRDFIDNTTWNSNYTTSLIDDLHAVNPHSDAIDIYVHVNGFDGSGGNAYDIPSPKCSVAASASFNFEHEMGHCLGLLHTFETADGTECADGSNCGSAGDLICDTPADFSGSQGFGNNCNFTGSQTINCNGGTFSYTPPTDNIMSYWAACYNEFTLNQATRMRNTIDGTGFLQDRLTPADRVITNVTLAGEIAVGAQNTILIGNIASLGDVEMNGNAHGIFNAGAHVQLVPGTHIQPTGNNGVLLTINSLCEDLLFTSNFPNDDRHTPAQMVSATDRMEVFPNPFSDKLMIRVRLDKAGPAT
ncbi:MAG: M43 family zinc metalloprotease, partial [Candidatus Nitrotoga sp.]